MEAGGVGRLHEGRDGVSRHSAQYAGRPRSERVHTERMTEPPEKKSMSLDALVASARVPVSEQVEEHEVPSAEAPEPDVNTQSALRWPG